MSFADFHTHSMALGEQINVQGVLPFSGLHIEQVYFTFLRCSSVKAATILSSKSINIEVISNAFCGHARTHFPHPSHFAAFMTT